MDQAEGLGEEVEVMPRTRLNVSLEDISLQSEFEEAWHGAGHLQPGVLSGDACGAAPIGQGRQWSGQTPKTS